MGSRTIQIGIFCALCAPLFAAETNFAELIRTPADIQRTLERCDGNSSFETELANWLESAEPSKAVREATLRLLADVTNTQVVYALSDGLLRHALEDLKRDQALVPEDSARILYTDVRKAVQRQASKTKAITVPAYSLVEDGTIADERQAAFLEKFLDLAEPRVAHVVRPASLIHSAMRSSGQSLTLSAQERIRRVARRPVE